MLNTYSSPIYAEESDVGANMQMLSDSGAKKRLFFRGSGRVRLMAAVLKAAGV